MANIEGFQLSFKFIVYFWNNIIVSKIQMFENYFIIQKLCYFYPGFVQRSWESWGQKMAEADVGDFDGWERKRGENWTSKLS